MSGLSDVTVNIQKGGIGLRQGAQDYISGLLWYCASFPSGMDSSHKEKQLKTLADAEALGITQTHTTFGVLWYQISEFFRMNPNGELWLGIYPVPGGSYTFTEIGNLLAASHATIRQVGVYANLLDYAQAQVTTIEGVMDTQAGLNYRASILYAPNFPAITDMTALADNRTLTARRVTTVIAQDGGGAGASLFASKGFSIPALGAALGCLSLAKVNQSIGNPANFNISSGTELEVLALANGVLLSTFTKTQLGAMKDKGYLIAIKRTPDISGSFFERCPTSVAFTDDIGWIELQRTIDKAVRALRSALVPNLQLALTINKDGTLTNDTIGYFKDLMDAVGDQMKADGETSNYINLIDPKQNLILNPTLVVTHKIQPTGTNEFITLNIGFAATL